jgi:hypothetical protein
MKPATNLVEAIHRFTPEPIEFGVGSKNEAFYVERPDDPLRKLRVNLLSSPGGTVKTLLAGHRGTGKSTELNRLAADPEIEARFAVVGFSVRKSLEITDIDHVDLLFTMVARTYEALSAEGVPLGLREQTVRALEGWRSQVVEKMEEVAEGASAELSTEGLLGFFGKFGGRLRFERSTRQVTRQVIQPRIGEFLGHVRDFFIDVQVGLDEHSGKRLLVLIEDLDKLPDIDKAEVLFSSTGPYLADPPVRVVYTVPIALHYKSSFAQIVGQFGESTLVPNVRLVSNDDGRQPYQPGIETMRAFVEHRMSLSLSGGLFQQLRRLIYGACHTTVGRKAEVLSPTDIQEAASDLRAELERPLTREHIAILHEVHATKQASADGAALELLHHLRLMEYRNGERWCDVNPLLLPTLRRWKPEATT